MTIYIGISCGTDRQLYRTMVTLNRFYVRAIEGTGAVPMPIPNVSPSLAKEYISRVDGLLLSGGADVATWRFGEGPHQKVVEFDAARDSMEEALFQEAYKRNMPILGVCRGMQYMNILLGGNLYQDLPSQLKDSYNHVSKETLEDGFHYIDLETEGWLAQWTGETKLLVNSEHHQALKDVATELKVVATSGDGVIEAVEGRDRPLYGVQFHPEAMIDNHPIMANIFQGFVKRAQSYREEKEAVVRKNLHNPES